MIYSVAVLLCFLSVGTADLFTNDPALQMTLWLKFKERFGKSYETPLEEGIKFRTFLGNLKIADVRNAEEVANQGTAVHGITKFSDMTQDEFAKTILMKVRPQTTVMETSNSFRREKKAVESIPRLVDWTGVYTTPIKNQGRCGSCWAFSATEQIESDSMRLLGTDYILAPEQIVQCDVAGSGCNGGWTQLAYEYVKSAGGIETEDSYPYTSFIGITGTCKAPDSFVLSLDSFSKISGEDSSDTESNMSSYVQTTGPLSICLDAQRWSTYESGIMSVCGKHTDHCVQAVGVYPAQNGGYWKVRNQWGEDWGEEGYIQLAYGKNTCGLTTIPTYTVVSLASS